MKRLYLDTNIFIDILIDRDLDNLSLKMLTPYLEHSQVYMSVLSVHITYYSLRIKPNSPEHKMIKKILSLINLIPLDIPIMQESLDCFKTDFEDTLQYFSALSEECDYILTKDTKDFTKIKSISPSNIQIIKNLRKLT
jgi:predicted nucleic acid-binding protein